MSYRTFQDWWDANKAAYTLRLNIEGLTLQEICRDAWFAGAAAYSVPPPHPPMPEELVPKSGYRMGG